MIRFMCWCGFLLVVGIVGQGCTEAESNADETVEPEGSSYRLVAEFGGEDAFTYGVAVRDSIAVFGRGSDRIVHACYSRLRMRSITLRVESIRCISPSR
jgi:hypothetical protein